MPPLVLVLAAAADVCLGVGWVLQHHTAAQTRSSRASAWQALRRLIATPVWWAGIAAMTAGQSLAAWALQAGPVAAVEPLLVGCLLCAFGYAAWHYHERITRGELIGTLVLIAGVTMFLAAARPTADVRHRPTLLAVLAAVAAATVLAAAIITSGQLARHTRLIAAESAAFAAAAGVFYALQDVATRGAIDAVQRHDLLALLFTSWPYVVLGAATAGVLVSQAAFREARLDWSLPPTVAVQPLVGVGMGVGLLGEQLHLSVVTVPFELLSLPVTLVGVLIVGRAKAMRNAHLGRQRQPGAGSAGRQVRRQREP